MKGDITDYHSLFHAMKQHKPDIIFHLAAQPIVTASYKNPIDTFKTNVLGTVHVLEAAKSVESVRAIINVTSDKCYENDGSGDRAFVENDRLGGFDPYSASKACAEIVATSYQNHSSALIPRNSPQSELVTSSAVVIGQKIDYSLISFGHICTIILCVFETNMPSVRGNMF